MLRLLFLIAATCAVACSNNIEPLPCAGCQPPQSEVHNPVFPDGGLDDAGNITQSGCQAVCPKSMSCGMTKDDGGTVVNCGFTCGC